MIPLTQRKLLDRARETAAPDQAEFAELLRRYGGVDHVEDLTAAGLARLLDHFTVATRFRSRQRPILSAATIWLVERIATHRLELTAHVYQADLRGHAGVDDPRDLTGRGLLDLLTRWEERGLNVAGFNEERREITPGQLRLLHVARNRVEMTDRGWYGMLQDWGGVVSATDLDRRGFDLCMAFLEAMGFEREPTAPKAPAFGRRPGFASPEQVELIRALWREWIGSTPDSEATIEAGLNAWLERYHSASSLRFLTKVGAAKAITALKVMKRRKPSGSTREARHA